MANTISKTCMQLQY